MIVSSPKRALCFVKTCSDVSLGLLFVLLGVAYLWPVRLSCAVETGRHVFSQKLLGFLRGFSRSRVSVLYFRPLELPNCIRR